MRIFLAIVWIVAWTAICVSIATKIAILWKNKPNKYGKTMEGSLLFLALFCGVEIYFSGIIVVAYAIVKGIEAITTSFALLALLIPFFIVGAPLLLTILFEICQFFSGDNQYLYAVGLYYGGLLISYIIDKTYIKSGDSYFLGFIISTLICIIIYFYQKNKK